MTERLHFHFSLSRIGEGNGSPLQCSCLENPRDGEAWWAAVYGVAQSRTRLKRLSSSSSSIKERDSLLPFTITSKRMKYLGINTPSYMLPPSSNNIANLSPLLQLLPFTSLFPIICFSIRLSFLSAIPCFYPHFHIFYFPHPSLSVEGGGSQKEEKSNVRLSKFSCCTHLFMTEFH